MQFIDLKAQYQALKVDIDRNIHNVLDHGQYVFGPEVAEFEKQLSEYVGVKHAITCANGTDALQMLFMAYEIGKGDAIFTSDITFVATAEPAYMLGATPVFCDIQTDTYNLCPESLERQIEAVLAEGKLTPRAVVAVDILGNPCDYDKLDEVCKKYDMILIEDAAQSFGGEFNGKKCGSFGHSAISSFFPAKPLGCYGDGGAVFTNDDVLAKKLRSIYVHGKGPNGKYDNIMIGMNSRLDTIQAAILLAKLSAFKSYELDKRQDVASYYSEKLKDGLKVPFVSNNCLSAWAQYALWAKDNAQRDAIIEYLSKNNIPNMVYYPKPQHELPVYKSLDHYTEEFKNSIEYCSRVFSIPMHPYLTKDEQDFIVNIIKEVL